MTVQELKTLLLSNEDEFRKILQERKAELLCFVSENIDIGIVDYFINKILRNKEYTFIFFLPVENFIEYYELCSVKSQIAASFFSNFLQLEKKDYESESLDCLEIFNNISGLKQFIKVFENNIKDIAQKISWIAIIDWETLDFHKVISSFEEQEAIQRALIINWLRKNLFSINSMYEFFENVKFSESILQDHFLRILNDDSQYVYRIEMDEDNLIILCKKFPQYASAIMQKYCQLKLLENLCSERIEWETRAGLIDASSSYLNDFTSLMKKIDEESENLLFFSEAVMIRIGESFINDFPRLFVADVPKEQVSALGKYIVAELLGHKNASIASFKQIFSDEAYKLYYPHVREVYYLKLEKYHLSTYRPDTHKILDYIDTAVVWGLERCIASRIKEHSNQIILNACKYYDAIQGSFLPNYNIIYVFHSEEQAQIVQGHLYNEIFIRVGLNFLLRLSGGSELTYEYILRFIAPHKQQINFWSEKNAEIESYKVLALVFSCLHKNDILSYKQFSQFIKPIQSYSTEEVKNFVNDILLHLKLPNFEFWQKIINILETPRQQPEIHLTQAQHP